MQRLTSLLGLCNLIVTIHPMSSTVRATLRTTSFKLTAIRKLRSNSGGAHEERGARAYNGGLGGRAPSGVQGQNTCSGGGKA